MMGNRSKTTTRPGRGMQMKAIKAKPTGKEMHAMNEKKGTVKEKY